MRARAVTLLEVVAALAILAATATTLLVAQSRSMIQLQATREQAHAALLVRELKHAWKIAPDSEVPQIEGGFENEVDWRWVRRVTASTLVTDPSVSEVTLTVFKRSRANGTERQVTKVTWLEKKNAQPSPAK